ncbi:PREDICTED: uncharacterized protein LOC108561523 isoform X2 [Nicrophorus vespilloides]|uniref:Uncharacterized protein LOC108561523 isoform X2 n=1 Tax=Nicrophorus vespilloides TaxID=110193 RepID=A0ABM1MK96_NICVS|nr:PREDICTED: uncharacterized protein LOC108561523 isoform X2 [Nicrophorus vespilloides]
MSMTYKRSTEHQVKCGLCSRKVTKKDFKAHVKNCHSVDIVVESLKFVSIEKFRKWKASLEQDTDIKFIRKCGKIVGSPDVIRFYCHQSKCYTECGKHQIERRKVIEAYCPANIKLVVFPNGKCSVRFVKTHIGHLNVYYPSGFIKKVDENIVDINQNDSALNEVLEKMGTVMKNSGSFNVDVWIESLKKSCCVLFYKAKGSIIEECRYLAYNDFILIVMSPAQRRVLQKKDFDFIYVGGTRNIDTNGYELITLMIVDDTQQSFPCAFFISNRVDEVVLNFFFSFVKETCGKLLPNFFMSDINGMYFDAWISIMNMLVSMEWLYTENSVKTDWKKNQTKIKSAKKRNEIYELLTKIMSENNEDSFDQLIDSLKTKLTDDSELVEYDKYITDNYLDHCSNWAYCYRKKYGGTSDADERKKIESDLYDLLKKIDSIDSKDLNILKYGIYMIKASMSKGN